MHHCKQNWIYCNHMRRVTLTPTMPPTIPALRTLSAPLRTGSVTLSFLSQCRGIHRSGFESEPTFFYETGKD